MKCLLITLKLNCTQNSAWLPVLKYKLHLRIKCMLHAARSQEYVPHLLQKSLLSCGQKDLSRWGRCKRGLEEGDIRRLNNSCPSLPAYPHQLSKSWDACICSSHSCCSCVLIPYNISKSQASPTHLPRAAIILSAQSPGTSSRDLGRRSL